MTTVSVTGIAAIQKTLDALDGRDRQNTLRRAVRAATKPLAAAMREVAAASDVPRSFQKIPAAKVSTRRGAGGRSVGANVRPKSPLFNIFEPGAGPHGISAAGGMLANEQAGFFARGRVQHPGMAARPITPRAFQAGAAAASKALADAILGTPE